MFDLFQKNFVYQPLNTATGEIRLIRVLPRLKRGHIQCQLEHFQFDHAPPYIALSYTWNDPIPNSEAGHSGAKLIHANKTSLRIGNNLVSALQHLRRNQPLDYVWADAICINQSNLLERGQQVLRMARIYGAAQKTIVWLGPEDRDSNLAIDLMRFLAEKVIEAQSEVDRVSLFRKYLTDKAHAKAWKALDCLLKRTWWTRMWIVQEMAVSRNIGLPCGDSLISWNETTSSLYSILYAYNSVQSILESRDILLDYSPLDNVFCIVKIQDSLLSGGSLLLERCLSQLDGFVASDDRDYIYAILALASDASTLVPHPDYSMTTYDMYNTLVRSYIEKHKSLDIIYLRLRLDAPSPLPSWVPDWALPGNGAFWKDSLLVNHTEEEGLVQCAAALTVPFVSYSPDLKVLTCRGFSIDAVDGCSLTGLEASYGQGLILQPIYRNCAYASSEEAFSAIWRTLVRDLIVYKDRLMKSPEICGWLFAKACRKYDSRFGNIGNEQSEESGDILDNSGFSKWYTKTKDFAICGRTLQDWVNDDREDRHVSSEAEVEMSHSFNRYWSSSRVDERLITTEKGYVDMAPYWAQRGDKVCILLGSSLPVLLRPVDDHYILVGPCYIHGIMFGEAMNLLDKGEVELEDFAVH
ncbi:hypothetical protein MMC17_004208 [Xylographa soralifera]|nr:hypothetical protein [Xylographa soralifera]